MRVSFDNLNSLTGLDYIDKRFIKFVSNHNKLLAEKILFLRQKTTNISSLDYSEFIIETAPILDDFLTYLFNIEQENDNLKKEHQKYNIIYECKRKFVQRIINKLELNSQQIEIDILDISKKLEKLIGKITSKNFAHNVLLWQKNSSLYKNEINIAAKYATYMVQNNSTMNIFDIPRPINYDNAIRLWKIKQINRLDKYIGYNYRDNVDNIEKSVLQAKYCIYCHKQNKDSCTKGIGIIKNNNNAINKLSVDLNKKNTGCPLKQKISEINKIKSLGFNLAALAIIILDNPLVAATGHRICNDCMKSCIYQKQDPVNIPFIESNILNTVLNMPWGVEIYLLLTKWNPLNLFNPVAKPASGYNVLVTGLGPSGFSLCHYLLNEGHNVTAIDSFKISHLKFDIKKPIKHWSKYQELLSQKIPTGFGGVMAYGITHRWNKNNLTLIRLILERRNNFNIYSGIRLGSNITISQAFNLGFDHIALCIGTGKVKFINDNNYFIKGIKSAVDFLMQLQQEGAYLDKSNSNLLIRLPVVIIGCGLTAIDSATEIFHYYPILVNKLFSIYNRDKTIFNKLNTEDKKIAQELISHAKLFNHAKDNNEKLNIIKKLGGVTICYRKNITESPAYKINPEEIEYALSIGIKFKDHFFPKHIFKDKFGYLSSILFNNNEKLSAKTILIAIGTNHNEFTDINDQIDFNYNNSIFKNKKCTISYFGDCNPKYRGSVVKAIASAKEGYKLISQKLYLSKPRYQFNFQSFIRLTDKIFISTIKKINNLTLNLIEIIIYSPYAAQNFRPGQFFCLRNFSYDPSKLLEPLALSAITTNIQDGTITFVILNKGKSTNLCKNLTVNEKVSLMGPTGCATKLHFNKKVCLIGEGINNTSLIPIAQALKNNGCDIIYFAYYQNNLELFYQQKIENCSNIVVWCCPQQQLLTNRKTDFSYKGDIIDAISYYKNILINISQVICSVSYQVMLKISNNSNYFPNKDLICRINPPMQCMMKGICGHCLQKVNDSKGYIFSCSNQEHIINNINFNSLSNNLNQNNILEYISNNN